MKTPNRRAFLRISAGSLCAVPDGRPAAAALRIATTNIPLHARATFANGLNYRLFAQNREVFGLTAVMAIRPIDGKFGSYPTESLFLFPFKRGAAGANALAFLPDTDEGNPLLKIVPMTTHGLPPDEYFCHYVLRAPWQGFISCALDMPIAREISEWPWYSNVIIGQGTVGIRWTSSNLNDPWFAGSRWIPEHDEGAIWRARIIEGIRRAAATTFGA